MKNICKHGHRYTKANTHINSKGNRECKKCKAAHNKKASAARRKKRLMKRLQRRRNYILPHRMELAWAAGLFEGEGSIGIVKNNRRNTTRSFACIGNTDHQIIDFFHQRWGGSMHVKKAGNNQKPAYYWALTGTRAGWFVTDLLPYFKSRRNLDRTYLIISTEKARLYAPKSKATKSLITKALTHFKQLNARGSIKELPQKHKNVNNFNWI